MKIPAITACMENNQRCLSLEHFKIASNTECTEAMGSDGHGEAEEKNDDEFAWQQ